LQVFFFSPSFLTAAEIEEQRTVPRLFGAFSPKNGGWSEYAIYDKSTGKRTVMRMSIVGIEADAFWYEVENREGGGSNIVKMLLTGDPNDPENIQRLIMKSGANPAQEMPRDFVLMGRRMASHMFEQRSGIPSNPALKLENKKTGVGSATVPAGTFDVRYKINTDVHPFGVVSSDAENATMVLVGYGIGAKSLITQEPAMMTRPPGMPEGAPIRVPPGMGQLPGQGPGNPIRQNPGMGRGYEPKYE
jgi:hypothetical protein